MDGDAVPQRLRKVAASSARTLPPPLERSVFDVLTDDEAFRSSVRERWTDDGGSDQLVTAFLEDPSSVDAELAALASNRRSAETAAEVADLRDRLGVAEVELGEAKARLVDLRDAAAAELRQAKAADKRSREGLERRLANAERVAADAEAKVAGLESTLAERDRAIADLGARLDRLRSRGSTDGPVVVERAGVGNDPSAIAAELDDWERRIRPFRPGSSDESGIDDRVPVELPAGIAPDTAEAVDSLGSLGVHVLVDGYNLGGVIAYEGFTEREGRDRVLVLARSLARTVDAVTVVFDAADVEGRSSYAVEGGVSVRFSAGQSADDLIVGIVRDSPVPIAVITNDRELRDRASERGAVVVWSDALILWAETR